MRIRQVRIKNFRMLRDLTIDFDSVTTLIGPNGSGKSSVLRALDWFFNGGKGAVLSERDCSFGATSVPIEVQVTFDSLTPADREALGKYSPPTVPTFTAWKRRGIDGSEVLSANAKGFLDFEPIKSAKNATDKKTAYNTLRTSKPTLELPVASTSMQIDQALTQWEAANLDKLVDSPEELQTNFFGFNSGGVMGGLFDYVLVTADLRASEESVDAKSSVIGRILERSVDRSLADEEIAAIVETSRAEQQKVYDEKFKDRLEEISTNLSNVVSTYSPGRAIAVSPNRIELKAPRTTFAVSVLDGNAETTVELQGHGFQRTLLISALQLLAESSSASTEGVICLAIEEPELFQHPVQAQAFAKVLRSLAEDESKRMQVAYATHSPYFLEARHFDQVRRLTRSSDSPPVVRVQSSTLTDVTARLRDIVDSAVVTRQLDGVVTDQLSVALFAERALLVEGNTDRAVFYGLGDRTSPGFFETRGVSVVAVGGKPSLPLVHAILESLGVPTYAVFDGDVGYEARATKAGTERKTIASEIENHIRLNKLLLGYFGSIEEDFSATQVGPKAAVFADNLETFMTEEWMEWEVACRALERSAGVSLKKNQIAYRQATTQATGSLPEVLTDIVTKLLSA